MNMYELHYHMRFLPFEGIQNGYRLAGAKDRQVQDMARMWNFSLQEIIQNPISTVRQIHHSFTASILLPYLRKGPLIQLA